MDGDDALFALAIAAPILLSVSLAVGRRRGWLMSRARPLRLAVVNAAVFALFVSIAFVAFETYYRFIYDTTDAFTMTKTTRKWFRRHVALNARGLREVDFESSIAPGRRRIVFLGDSFTAGHGVDQVDRRFSNLIRARHPEWEVINLAIFGWETSHEIEALRLAESSGLELDVVVLVYCMNDISDLMTDWNRRWHEVQARLSDVGWLVEHSYFVNTYWFRLIARRDPELFEYETAVKDAYRGPLFEAQAARLDALKALVEKRGGRLLAVTFPSLDRLGPAYDYKAAHEKLALHWKKAGVTHLDLLPAMSAHANETLTVNRFDAHPNERAHAIAAEAIDAFLREALNAP